MRRNAQFGGALRFIICPPPGVNEVLVSGIQARLDSFIGPAAVQQHRNSLLKLRTAMLHFRYSIITFTRCTPMIWRLRGLISG